VSSLGPEAYQTGDFAGVIGSDLNHGGEPALDHSGPPRPRFAVRSLLKVGRSIGTRKVPHCDEDAKSLCMIVCMDVPLPVCCRFSPLRGQWLHGGCVCSPMNIKAVPPLWEGLGAPTWLPQYSPGRMVSGLIGSPEMKEPGSVIKTPPGRLASPTERPASEKATTLPPHRPFVPRRKLAHDSRDRRVHMGALPGVERPDRGGGPLGCRNPQRRRMSHGRTHARRGT
jgi:hypothetical protein